MITRATSITLIICSFFATLLLEDYCFAVDDFYTNGRAIGSWDHFPNRTLTDANGKVHKGYKQAWHFILRSPGDIFLQQEAAVVFDDMPQFTYVYDPVSRLWKGRWDNELGLYARLELKLRRSKLSQIPEALFPEAKDEPTLFDMTKRPSEPPNPSDKRKATAPADFDKFTVASTDSRDIDEVFAADSNEAKHSEPKTEKAPCIEMPNYYFECYGRRGIFGRVRCQ